MRLGAISLDARNPRGDVAIVPVTPRRLRRRASNLRSRANFSWLDALSLEGVAGASEDEELGGGALKSVLPMTGIK